MSLVRHFSYFPGKGYIWKSYRYAEITVNVQPNFAYWRCSRVFVVRTRQYPVGQNSSEKTTAVVTNEFSVRRRPSLSCLIHAVLAVSNALAAATAPRATAVTVETRTLLASRVTSRATNRVTSSWSHLGNCPGIMQDSGAPPEILMVNSIQALSGRAQ